MALCPMARIGRHGIVLIGQDWCVMAMCLVARIVRNGNVRIGQDWSLWRCARWPELVVMAICSLAWIGSAGFIPVAYLCARGCEYTWRCACGSVECETRAFLTHWWAVGLD